MNENISHILRRLMDKAKITEAELARKTLTPQPTLHRILTGATLSPRGKSLSKLAKYFSVTIDQLIGNDPLPPDYTPGVRNLQTRSWKSIPLISLSDAAKYFQLSNSTIATNDIIYDSHNWPHWTTTDLQTSEVTFAININIDSLSPRFPNGTVLVVEPNLEAEDHDFVIVHTQGSSTATVKQLLLDGQTPYLKPLNPEFQTAMMGNDDVILGVVLQARMDIRRRQHATADVVTS